MEEPADLGIRIGTETEVLWTNVKKSCEADIKNARNTIAISEELLVVAERKIEEEKLVTPKQ